MEVLRRVNKTGGDIWTEMGTNKFFDIKILTTNKNSRKAGLARELIKRSIDLSKVLGFKAIKTEATGSREIMLKQFLVLRISFADREIFTTCRGVLL